MPRLLLSMCDLACRLGTVLNILCLLQKLGFLSFRCEPLCFLCISEGRKEGRHHLLRSF